ncbi:MAG TPA: hypothetical protein VFX33_05900 [Actinomycetales bacterium]|nr:hypothetical protein [Actinomycetales bacterium]
MLPNPRPAELDPQADCAEDLASVLASLLADMRFAELGHSVRSLDALRGRDRARVLELCEAGRRLLDLDAVGFGEVDGVSPDLRAAVLAMQFPPRADTLERGSLTSLAPLFGLMLECLNLRWQRKETSFVTLLLHLMAEYLPLLAWEPVLGHAGDPLRLRHWVTGTLWATPECPAPQHRKSAAERVLFLRPESPDGVQAEQWKVYLDRWHARVAGMLRQCALRPGDGRPNPESGGCDRPCGVVTKLDDATLADLAARVALATAFADSPVVALRHAAPVGHFFGVPEQDEIALQWKVTVERLCRPWGGSGDGCDVGNPTGGELEVDEDEPLPGLTAFLSVVAGRPIRPTTLLSQLREDISRVLSPLLAPTH